jgi:sugar phosphate isomerase/epimerase
MFFTNQRRNRAPADFDRKVNLEQSSTCELPSGGGALQDSARFTFQRTACQPQIHRLVTASSVRPAQILSFNCMIDHSSPMSKRSHMAVISRRSFLGGAGAIAAACAARPLFSMAEASKSPFRISVINDEISQDFDHACYVASHDFGMSWIELRSMWGKNTVALSAAEIGDAQKILAKYNLQVTDIASPLFKTHWPGAPMSRYGDKQDMHGAAETTFKQQDEVLERSISLAKEFKTGKVRCFDFWRLDDVAPYRAAIDEKLRSAADTAGQQDILLVLENEFECNTATGREAARTLNAIQTPHLALNWDPANAVMRGELDAFPTAWELLPKNRIHHCHCKNAVKGAEGKIEWSPVDKGFIDWTEQFRALKQCGFRDAVSLETHWTGGGTPEQCSRISWAGMKRALKDSGTL